MQMSLGGPGRVLCTCMMAAVTCAQAEPRAVAWWLTTSDMASRLTPQPELRLAPGAAEAPVVIEVDEAQTFQTILGLGASLEHSTCANLWRLDETTRADVVERLVSPEHGIGMNLMRICMGTPDFTREPWYSYDDMPPGETDEGLRFFSIDRDRAYILPVLKLAREKNPDLLFFASPWSPPGWMKTTGDLIGGHLYPRYYGAYAQYFVRFIQAYEAEGIPIRAVTVQNEPGVNKKDDVESWWYPSCQWSLVVDEDTWWPVPLEVMGHAERDFIRDHLGPALKEAGLQTRIWCFDHNLNNLWYPRNILTDPRAAAHVEGTAFHPYAGEAHDMGAFLQEFPDKSVHLTEGSVYGVEGAVELIHFLRNGASSYNAWVTVIDTRGKPNNGPFDCTDTCVMIDADTLEVRYTLDYFIYGHFMKFTARGAVRIGCTDTGATTVAHVAHVAVRNPDDTVVLVVANPSKEAQPLSIRWRDTATNVSIPPEAVATFRWRA